MKRSIVALWAVIFALMPFVALAQDSGGTTTPLDSLSDYALYAAIAGFVGVWVVAGLNQAHWSSVLKFGVFFAWCLIAAAGDSYFTRTLDWSNWSRALLVVFFTGQATYLAGKPAIKQFEAATSGSAQMV